MREDARPPARFLHLADDDVAGTQRAADGPEVAPVARLAQRRGVADDRVGPVGRRGELRDQRVAQVAREAIEVRSPGLVVERYDGDGMRALDLGVSPGAPGPRARQHEHGRRQQHGRRRRHAAPGGGRGGGRRRSGRQPPYRRDELVSASGMGPDEAGRVGRSRRAPPGPGRSRNSAPCRSRRRCPRPRLSSSASRAGRPRRRARRGPPGRAPAGPGGARRRLRAAAHAFRGRTRTGRTRRVPRSARPPDHITSSHGVRPPGARRAGR